MFYEHGCWFITMVPTTLFESYNVYLNDTRISYTQLWLSSIDNECKCQILLFKSVRSSSHEQSVPTCMNKPVNNHAQAGQLNHVQACQQPCSSCPAQPCSSLSTGKNKLRIFTPCAAHFFECLKYYFMWTYSSYKLWLRWHSW